MALIPEWFSVLERFWPGTAGPVMKPGNSLCDVYARVSGAVGAVSWTWVWEPLDAGDAPTVYQGVGPVELGQNPAVLNQGWDAPAQWMPNDAASVAIVNFSYSGVLYLYALLDGVALEGRLVLTIMGQYEGDSYPNVSFSYEGPDPGGEDAEFWVDHRNTYEIP